MTTHELAPTPTQIQVERIPGFGTAGRSTMPESYWGIAELQSFTRKPSGHCYLDLLESEQGGQGPRNALPICRRQVSDGGCV